MKLQVSSIPIAVSAHLRAPPRAPRGDSICGERSVKIKGKFRVRHEKNACRRLDPRPSRLRQEKLYLWCSRARRSVKNRITGIRNIKLFSVRDRAIAPHHRHLRSRLRSVILSRTGYSYLIAPLASLEHCFALIAKISWLSVSLSPLSSPSLPFSLSPAGEL